MALAKEGEKRIEWARRHMPVLDSIKQEFEKEKPLKGARIVACLHVTVETANLITTLVAGGAGRADSPHPPARKEPPPAPRDRGAGGGSD